MSPLALLALATLATPAPPPVVANDAFELHAALVDGRPQLVLRDLRTGRTLADGPTVYRAVTIDGRTLGLTRARVEAAADRLTVHARLGDLAVEQTFVAPAAGDWVEEHLRLTNVGGAPVELRDLVIGLTRAAADLGADRFAAMPLRRRADRLEAQDYSTAQILTEPGWEYRHNAAFSRPKSAPAPHYFAEGWVWAHGTELVAIYSHAAEVMRWSVVAPEGADRLRFGGLSMVSGQPDALASLPAGASLDLGVTRYVSLRGGWADAAAVYRAWLDSLGYRFPADFDPPVHWEQLYDMEGDWNDRPRRYTLAKLELQAQQGVAYHTEALYLDPGWDTTFGSLLWGPWLGTPAGFVADLAARHGLKTSLHCPLAPWSTTPGMGMGPVNTADWPAAALRQPPDLAAPDELRAPALRDGRRNLALLPAATASASSTIAGYAIHQVAHLIDGWAGNSNSWVAETMPAWVEIDLGAAYTLGAVRLGNDDSQAYHDRQTVGLTVRLAAEPDAWVTVAEDTAPLTTARELTFAPTRARWVRLELAASLGNSARLDEVEVLEATALPARDHAAWEASVRRGEPGPAASANEPLFCFGSQQYLAAAEQRLLDLAAAGVTFFMYDGTWYSGDCADPAHGHPIPYRVSDHLRACLDLCRRVKAQYPDIVIELHDMLAGGDRPRMTPVYYGYAPDTYDDNWGFELMWDPMADLRQGRGLALYDYNLGCNIPAYLHIDLRKDNQHAVMLWWFASTCRHLGIGGTHADPVAAAAQREAMAYYARHAAHFKRGEFHGLSEEVHVHSLDGSAVVNAFNLSDEPRRIIARRPLAALDLPTDRALTSDQPWLTVADGQLRIAVDLPPWGAAVAAVGP